MKISKDFMTALQATKKQLLSALNGMKEEETLEEVGTDIFTSEEEATKRAEELGCELTHTVEKEDGTVCFMPCESHDIYEEKVANQEEVEEEVELSEEVVNEEVELTEEVKEEIELTEEVKETVELNEEELPKEEMHGDEDHEEEEEDYKMLYEEALKEIEALKSELKSYDKEEEEMATEEVELSSEEVIEDEIKYSPEATVETKPLHFSKSKASMTTSQRAMFRIANLKK